MAAHLPPCSLGQEPKVAVHRSGSLLHPTVTPVSAHLAGVKATLPKVLGLHWGLRNLQARWLRFCAYSSGIPRASCKLQVRCCHGLLVALGC